MMNDDAIPVPDDDALADGGSVYDGLEFAEIAVLSALLQLDPDTARPVMGVLRAEDFTDSGRAGLFRLMKALNDAGAIHDAVMVAHAINDRPETLEHHRMQLRATLVRTVGEAMWPDRAPHYARAVVAAEYRRSFRVVGEAIAESADIFATADLWENMCAIGRRQRELHQRYLDAGELTI